ncbi:hypothetical protein DFQ26_002729 [Actinomortierella ambigua]|nr:hypothetical protein DFQ26_002729 [Actinomortierella ambigua]
MPSLPIECLEAISDHVCDRGTLFSLLTVNRAFFTLAVSRLYYAPFHWVDLDSNFEKFALLLKLALRLSPVKDNDTERLREYWDILPLSANDGSFAPMIDYFSYVRCLLRYPRYRAEAIFGGNLVTEMSQEHFEGKRFLAMCNLQKTVQWLFCESHLERIQRLQIPLWDIDRYQKAIPRMHRVEEVVFDVNTGYMPAMESTEIGYFEQSAEFCKQFLSHYQPPSKPTSTTTPSSLSTFSSSALSSPPSPISGTESTRNLAVSFENYSYSSDSRKRSRQLQLDLYRHMPPLFQPRLLDETNFLRFATRPLETDLSRLKSLSVSGCQYGWKLLHRGAPSSGPSQLVRASSILQRCRNLNELFTTLPDGDEREQLFSWAVKEKNLALDQDEAVVPCDVKNGGSCLPPQRPHPEQQSRLVQIQKLAVQCRGSGGLIAFQEAMYGFGHSLREADFFCISIDGQTDDSDGNDTDDDSDLFEYDMDAPAPLNVVTQDPSMAEASDCERQLIGEDWRLPHLVHLTIHSDKVLPLADQAFDHAHKLENLQITDKVSSYVVNSGEWRRLKAWTLLTNLTQLELMGQITTEFHPASFQYMPNLEILTLRGPGFGRFCCSPSYRQYTLPAFGSPKPDSMQNSNDDGFSSTTPSPTTKARKTTTTATEYKPLHESHLWTWDWSLLNLRHMSLEGEPAYRFDLKWLRYCPKLESLNLRIGGHRRPLTMDGLREDLAKDGLCLPSSSSSSASFAEKENDHDNTTTNTTTTTIFASQLVELHLHGRFLVCDADLQSILTFCPSLRELTLGQATRFSMPMLMAATASDVHTSLERVTISRRVNFKDCANLGLVPRQRRVCAGHFDRTLDPESEEYLARAPGRNYRPEYRFLNGYFMMTPKPKKEEGELEGKENGEDQKQWQDEEDVKEQFDWLFEISSDLLS